MNSLDTIKYEIELLMRDNSIRKKIATEHRESAKTEWDKGYSAGFQVVLTDEAKALDGLLKKVNELIQSQTNPPAGGSDLTA